ncbi:SAM-dependent methyltransferase [Luteipulveratus halotolerans]|uniref:SAM-dependent methyltransferase n=1 Tax=Luteipulveratus halotolerans TaxID=1631356 RepID=A0A0L6CN20_9MICO|nr:SAM-dependent methyltransferase [Luteipulveratus halotolerans]
MPSLRDALRDVGFTLDGVADCLGERASRALHREQAVPADLVTRTTTAPVGVLVRLFTLGRPVSASALDRVLPGWDVDRLARTGLVSVEGDHVRTLFDLRPYGDEQREWWVLSDLSEVMTGRPLPVDHVLGIGGASTTLASWTTRTPVGRALDLGTGCGVQSLHLSQHASSVVATDISQRALATTRFNAALNDLDWDVRGGSMLEPVGDETFDLVVSNPPFVITPRSDDMPTYEYRDGGQVGHAVVADLVRSVEQHLTPGGVAQLLGNWEVPEGGSWEDVVGGWLAGTGLDAWVVQRDVQDPAEYAELWAGDGGHRSGTTGFEQMYAAWLADFESRGVGEIGFGVITLQRPRDGREPWRDLVASTGSVASPMGPSVAAGLAARTWLAEHGDAGVLATAWQCAADVTEERHGRPGADDPSVILVRQGGGLGRAFRADTVLAAYLSVCDGSLTAGQALDAIATLVDASPETVRAQAVPQIRDLIADGLLIDPTD